MWSTAQRLLNRRRDVGSAIVSNRCGRGYYERPALTRTARSRDADNKSLRPRKVF